VHMEPVVDGVVLELGHVAGHIDCCHWFEATRRWALSGGYLPWMTDDDLVDVLRDAAAAVRATLDVLEDWGLAGTRPGPYRSDRGVVRGRARWRGAHRRDDGVGRQQHRVAACSRGRPVRVAAPPRRLETDAGAGRRRPRPLRGGGRAPRRLRRLQPQRPRPVG